ncbi:MAG: hypothetical protein ACFFB2_13315 [Promethearchaeota archaeon]
MLSKLISINKLQKISTGIVLLCLFNLSGSRTGSSPYSMIPIIETPQSEIKAFVGTSFILTYIIIDDNPYNYSLKRNEALLTFGRIESSILNFTRQEPQGDYVFTLKVTDFSHNVVSKNINVTIATGPFTTSTGTKTMTETSSQSEAVRFSLLSCFLGVMLYITRKSHHRRLVKKD